MNPRSNRPAHSVTWLALTLSFGYFAFMAILMWLFENALAQVDLSEIVDLSGRGKYWALIVFTAVLIFVTSRWALSRLATPADDAGADPGADLEANASSPLPASATDRRDTVAFVVVLGIILSGTAWVVINEQEEVLDNARYRRFELIGEVKAKSVARWVDERRRDMLTLIDNDSFAADLARWMDAESRSKDVADALRVDLEALMDANNFDGIAVVDRSGKLSLGVPDDLRARTGCKQAAGEETNGNGRRITLSHSFDGPDALPKLDVIGRILARDADLSSHQATLCMRLDLSQRLLPMVSQWPGVALSGEVLLGRVDGNDIVVLNHRASADAPWVRQHLPGARARWEAGLDAAQNKALHKANNRHDTRKLLATYAVPDTPWLLLVRQDEEEANQLQSRRQTYVTIIAGFTLILVISGFAVSWARSSNSLQSFLAQREALLTRLRDMAFYDDLTGLPRRRLIEDRLDVALREAQRRKEAVDVLFIDVDTFKSINDRLGHAAGDAVLKAIAGRLQASLRVNDSAGRLGGDEFLVILPANADAADLEPMLTRFRAALHQPLDWEGQIIDIHTSIGLAVYPRDGAAAPELIAFADAEMYKAKHGARAGG